MLGPEPQSHVRLDSGVTSSVSTRLADVRALFPEALSTTFNIINRNRNDTHHLVLSTVTALVKRQQRPRMEDGTQFLEYEQKRCRSLSCFYCHARLEIYRWSDKSPSRLNDMAFADRYIPDCMLQDPNDAGSWDRLVVSCHKCKMQKAVGTADFIDRSYLPDFHNRYVRELEERHWYASRNPGYRQ